MNEQPEISPRSLNLFFMYAHEDRALHKRLSSHLYVLKAKNIILGWYDQNIVAGTDWSRGINKYIDIADIILLSISNLLSVKGSLIYGMTQKLRQVFSGRRPSWMHLKRLELRYCL